jgi:hypothetical protein
VVKQEKVQGVSMWSFAGDFADLVVFFDGKWW